MIRFSLFLFIIILISFSAGCGSKSEKPQPPDLRLGEDACDECRMIINEKRFASAFETESGEVKRFDDIGCMLAYKNKFSVKNAVFWVNSFTNSEWINANDAVFVMGKSIDTPMAFGIIAVKDRNQTESITKNFEAKVLSFNELEKEFKQNN